MRFFLACVMMAAFLFPAGSALAAPPTLGWGAEVNAGRCDTSGRPVVNVVHKVTGSVDSGEAGNYWAYSRYNKRIQLWDQGEGVYCAVVGYLGRFSGVAGQQSPGNTEPLDGDENGTFQGGYRAIVSGELLAQPGWPTRGQLGAFDYECDIAGNCPGAVNWLAQYFESGYAFEYEWWGWIYRGGRHGTWVNSSDGNAGDVV